jgi:hypothetical protein
MRSAGISAILGGSPLTEGERAIRRGRAMVGRPLGQG